MSFPTRLPPKTGQWFSEWEPAERPIQLPLPKLEYDSQFGVWEWKLRNLLRHNSLLLFIDSPGPPATSLPMQGVKQEELAAAAHCLALLGSCISEDILADLVTLSPYNKLSDDPYQLFADVKKHVNNAQYPWKQSDPRVWEVFAKEGVSSVTLGHLLDGLNRSHLRLYKKDGFRNFILMAALVVKWKFPFCPIDIVRRYIAKAKDVVADVGETTWFEMRKELMGAI